MFATLHESASTDDAGRPTLHPSWREPEPALVCHRGHLIEPTGNGRWLVRSPKTGLPLVRGGTVRRYVSVTAAVLAIGAK